MLCNASWYLIEEDDLILEQVVYELLPINNFSHKIQRDALGELILG